jgi:hypothetical protein
MGVPSKSRQGNNGFKRNFKHSNITIANVLKLESSAFDFVGKPENNILLRGYQNTQTLFEIDNSLANIKSFNLELPSSFNIKSTYVNIGAFMSSLYFTNPYGDVAIIGYKNKFSIGYKVQKLVFDQAKLISNSSMIVRAIKGDGKERIRELIKVNLGKNRNLDKDTKYLLPKQIDGTFCNDGWLHYDKVQSKIFYTYYYRGAFLCLDTNLNLIFKGKTIDTVHFAKIKLSEYNEKEKNGTSNKKITQASTDNLINWCYTTDKDKIYIVSGLKADNESPDDFEKNNPIDIYSIKDGRYLYSIYIPKYKGYRINGFEVNGNLLVAIFDRYLVTFAVK